MLRVRMDARSKNASPGRIRVAKFLLCFGLLRTTATASDRTRQSSNVEEYDGTSIPRRGIRSVEGVAEGFSFHTEEETFPTVGISYDHLSEARNASLPVPEATFSGGRTSNERDDTSLLAERVSSTPDSQPSSGHSLASYAGHAIAHDEDESIEHEESHEPLEEGGKEKIPRQCNLRPVDEAEIREKLLVTREKWRVGRLKVYVQHMNKAGGTTLCKFFSGGLLRVPQACNCNGNPSFAPLTKGDESSIKELFQDKPYDVYFNEGPMFKQDMDMDHFLYLTSIRKPQYRVLSQMLHHWEGRYSLDENGTVHDLSATIQKYITNEELGGKSSIYHPNMQTQHLLGNRWKNMTSDIYEMALDRLFRFAFVIPTDDIDQGLENLGKFFHPSLPPLVRTTRLNVHDAASQMDSLLRQDPVLAKDIMSENLYDQCLYHQARLLHKVQTKVMRRMRTR